MKSLLAALLAAALAQAATLPVRRVVVYKNGVAFYERSGAVRCRRAGRPGPPLQRGRRRAQVAPRRGSGGVARIRYEFFDPLRMQSQVSQRMRGAAGLPLARLLDQWRGARVEMTYRGQPLAGLIVSARVAPTPNGGEKQELALMLDSGALAVVDLDAASGLRFSEPRLQRQLADALAAVAQELSRTAALSTSDLTGAGERRLAVRYLAPAPVWKSTYRLLLPDSGEASLEGWAIVENATGEDWNQVSLSVVSGRRVLHHPAAAGALRRAPRGEPAGHRRRGPTHPPRGRCRRMLGALPAPGTGPRPEAPSGRSRMAVPADATAELKAAAPAPLELSTVEPAAEGRSRRTVRIQLLDACERPRRRVPPSAFLSGQDRRRRLLLYSDRSRPNPRLAAEIANITGMTLDGGTVTVYHPSGYSGEALMEELKNGEKRLISYAIDQSVRVTTKFDSEEGILRGYQARRGVLITRTAAGAPPSTPPSTPSRKRNCSWWNTRWRRAGSSVSPKPKRPRPTAGASR